MKTLRITAVAALAATAACGPDPHAQANESIDAMLATYTEAHEEITAMAESRIERINSLACGTLNQRQYFADLAEMSWGESSKSRNEFFGAENECARALVNAREEAMGVALLRDTFTPASVDEMREQMASRLEEVERSRIAEALESATEPQERWEALVALAYPGEASLQRAVLEDLANAPQRIEPVAERLDRAIATVVEFNNHPWVQAVTPAPGR